MIDNDNEAAQVGRPSSYAPEYAGQAEKLCKLGATDFELADFFGVSVRTIHRWKIEHEDFCHAIKSGKDAADDRVERSLFAKAVGYSYPSEKVFQYEGRIIRAPIVEHVPPSDTAAIFWLKNRRKEDWRDRHELDHSHKLGQASDEEIESRIQSLLDKARG